MPASEPTILATSGGYRRGSRTMFEFAPLIHFAVELSGVSGRAPRICHLGTAGGDQQFYNAIFTEAGNAAGMATTNFNLFPMPSAADPAALLLEQDVVWVGGGSVANLLAVWRLHGLDEVLREVWQAGVVLAGVSAGSVCWHAGGTTDSFGPDLRPVFNGLGFVPYAAGVHYDSEAQRRPLFQQLIGSGELPAGYATDDGVGILYRGTEFVEAVTEVRGKGAYHVVREGEVGQREGRVGQREGRVGQENSAREERIEPRVLPGAA
jgi:peptidase E